MKGLPKSVEHDGDDFNAVQFESIAVNNTANATSKIIISAPLLCAPMFVCVDYLDKYDPASGSCVHIYPPFLHVVNQGDYRSRMHPAQPTASLLLPRSFTTTLASSKV